MSYTVMSITDEFPDAANYTASGDTDILIQAPTDRDIFWAVNASKPTESPLIFNRIPAGQGKALQLLDGENLWVSAPSLRDLSTSSVVLTS
jgi:hypothetical protein